MAVGIPKSTVVIIMLSLIRRLSTRNERYHWKPAVDLTNPRVLASLLSLYNR